MSDTLDVQITFSITESHDEAAARVRSDLGLGTKAGAYRYLLVTGLRSLGYWPTGANGNGNDVPFTPEQEATL